MNTNTEALEAKEQKARAAYEQAQTDAAEARQRDLNHQAARAREIDQETLNAYSDADHAQAIADAKQALASAIAGSDIGKAWVNYQAAQLRHAHASAIAAAAVGRLGLEHAIADRPAGNTIADLLAQTVDRLATNLVADELDQRDEQITARIHGKT